MDDLSVRDLEVFVAVYQLGNVTNAAAKLGLAQPTVSITLRKLRRIWGDPLFVRTSGGMRATPRAARLFPDVSQATAAVSSTFARKEVFDARTALRRFRLCVSDSSQIMLVPSLLEHLKREAPGVSIEVIPMSAESPRMLESGQADLALGNMPQLDAGFYRQSLFEQDFVCLFRTGHPRVRRTLTLKQYCAEAHVQIAMPIRSPGITDGMLDAARPAPRVGLRLPSFLGVSYVVARTDLLATVPERLGRLLASTSHIGIRAARLPVKVAPYPVRQHWHERYHLDAENRWLRQTIAALFADRQSPVPAATAASRR